ncbi:hypothetical protein TRAPUB_8980, partial [Trametes pubescens]
TLGKHTPAIAPIDKAGASTRILLHDTQAHLEKFTDRVTQLTAGLDSAKRELVMAQKLYQDDHEQVIDKISGLANRCQTELQKSIGSPAQSSDVREVTKDLSHLSSRLESLDKKIDSLSSLNQTQSQALQIIQQQQGQLLAALVPVLPLLQNVPLQIENARDRVKDSILELRQEALARDSMSRAMSSGNGYLSGSRRSRARSSGPSASCLSNDTVHIKHESLVRLARLSHTPRTPITPAPGRDTLVADAEGTSPMRAFSVAAAGGAQVGGMPPPSSVGKPMSLKDRRAMFAAAQQLIWSRGLKREEGKRFIPLNDEDDDDAEDGDSTL